MKYAVNDFEMVDLAETIREQSEIVEDLVWPQGYKDAIKAMSNLNFKIIGGIIEPENPKENTIWVNTDVEITDWVFNAPEPENPIDGMLWFHAGTSSTTPISVVKKHTIMIYPTDAKQYINGAWTRVSAYTYQNGTWNNWNEYYFDYSKQSYVWKASSMRRTTASNSQAATPTVAQNSDGSVVLTIPAVSSNYLCRGGCYLLEEVDLTGISTLVLEGADSTLTLSVIPVSGDAWGNEPDWGGDAVAYNGTSYNSEGYKSLDVSALNGVYDIALGIETWGSSISSTLKRLYGTR